MASAIRTSSVLSLKTSRIAAAGLPLLLAAGIAGCKQKPGPDVVATVNGHAIMRADLNRMYQTQLGQNPGQTPSAEQADSLRLNIVRELIDEEIVEQRAAKMNLTPSPEDVDGKLNEMKVAAGTDDQFNQQLKSSGRTLDDVKHDLRRSMTIDKLINKEINSKVTVSDADVTNYYNQHKAEFDLNEAQYHLAVIRVTSVPSSQPGNLQGSKATSDADAKKKIEALKNRLDSGEDFGTIAMNFSEDPNTSSSGGDMGFVPESQLRADPGAGAAILKLKGGEMTDVFPLLDGETKRPVGYSIYKLIEREPAGQRQISDPAVQQHIRQLLRDSRSQLLKNAYLEMLRDQAKVENFFAEQIFKMDAK